MLVAGEVARFGVYAVASLDPAPPSTPAPTTIAGSGAAPTTSHAILCPRAPSHPLTRNQVCPRNHKSNLTRSLASNLHT